MHRPRTGEQLPPAVCLELPLLVKNIGKAIHAVGGAKEIARVTCEAGFSKNREGLELRLRNDVFHHPVVSANLQCNNIIIELDIPAECIAPGETNVKRMLESARRLDKEVQVHPRWHITSLHRFRGMADFQYYTGDSRFARKAEASVLTGNLTGIQSLSFQASNDSRSDILPPPRFSVNTQPFYYGYRQSTYLKVVGDEQGAQHLVHTASSAKVISNIISWGEAVPQGAPAQLLTTQQRAQVNECVSKLRQLFSERPSYTKRTLQHLVGSVAARQLKFALPFVAYYYRSGPWRGAYIRYGIDPAQDPQMAKYQVEHFRIAPAEHTATQQETALEVSHVFDGSIYPDAPMLQLCDIADGVLESYINTTSLRTEVDENDGWFLEGTIGVIRKVLRQELLTLRERGEALTAENKAEILKAALDTT